MSVHALGVLSLLTHTTCSLWSSKASRQEGKPYAFFIYAFHVDVLNLRWNIFSFNKFSLVPSPSGPQGSPVSLYSCCHCALSLTCYFETAKWRLLPFLGVGWSRGVTWLVIYEQTGASALNSRLFPGLAVPEVCVSVDMCDGDVENRVLASLATRGPSEIDQPHCHWGLELLCCAVHSCAFHLFALIWDRVSLCGLNWLGIHYIAQADSCGSPVSALNTWHWGILRWIQPLMGSCLVCHCVPRALLQDCLTWGLQLMNHSWNEMTIKKGSGTGEMA